MATEWKYEDPIEEIYAIRRQISEECGHDVNRLFDIMLEERRMAERNGIRVKYANLPIARVAPAMA